MITASGGDKNRSTPVLVCQQLQYVTVHMCKSIDLVLLLQLQSIPYLFTLYLWMVTITVDDSETASVSILYFSF